MRIEKTNVQKIYSFTVEMNTDELWELFCMLDTHPYVQVAEDLLKFLFENVPEMNKFKKDESGKTESV